MQHKNGPQQKNQRYGFLHDFSPFLSLRVKIIFFIALEYPRGNPTGLPPGMFLNYPSSMGAPSST